MAEGAQIKPVADREQQVGRDARIFRDFALSQGMRLRVGDGAQIAVS